MAGYPERFSLELDFVESLQLYIFLHNMDNSLDESAQKLLAQLGNFLYQHLSIEELQFPEALVQKLLAQKHSSPGAS